MPFLAILLCTILSVSASAPTPGPTPAELSGAAAKDGLLHVLDRATRALMYEVAVARCENATIPLTVEDVHACPGALGGVQWNGPAFSTQTNMPYVPAVERSQDQEGMRCVPNTLACRSLLGW